MNNEENHLLKVDLSGIPDFIFDTPSDGAAGQLKERSFYVYALTKIAGYSRLLKMIGQNESYKKYQ